MRFVVVAVLMTVYLGAGCGVQPEDRISIDNSDEAEASPADPLNVVIVTLDTTRRDRLGVYGSTRGLTPNLDRVAHDGVVFLEARTQIPITAPAHMTLFTGLGVLQHRVRENGTFGLPDSALTLAEVLRDRGYRTAAFVSSFVLEERFGLAQGFDTYEDTMTTDWDEESWQGHEVPKFERRGDQTTDRALEWVQGLEVPQEPYFLWVHYYDPHEPYDAPDPWRRRFPNKYDAEVAFMDHQFGRLLEGISRARSLRKPLLVVASDHGEALGEHGGFGHGSDLFDPAMRVVLFFSLPGVVSSGVRVDEPVAMTSVPNTILNLSNSGGSILPGGDLSQVCITGESETTDEPLYMETMLPSLRRGESEVRGIIDRPWKLIDFPGTSQTMLFRLDVDPAETKDLLTHHPAEALRLKNQLKAWIQNTRPVLEPIMFELDETTKARLAALGYL